MELVDSGFYIEETDSDYEYPFTDYWWKFRCPECRNVIFYSSSYSVAGIGNKVKCDTCKGEFKLTQSYTCGKRKKIILMNRRYVKCDKK